MLRALIIEDETAAAVNLRAVLRETAPDVEVTGVLESVAESVEYLRNHPQPDLLFMDIHLADGDSFRIFDEVEIAAPVIFTTAYDRYALEAFKVNSIDYLLKPVSFDEFTDAVTRAVEILTHKATQATTPAETSITVRSDYRQVRIDHDDIAYIEGLKDYVKIYTLSRPRPVITQMSLKAIQHTLPSTAFMRVHRSYIIALRQVQSFDRSHALLRDTSIPIGDTYRAEFIAQMRL